MESFWYKKMDGISINDNSWEIKVNNLFKYELFSWQKINKYSDVDISTGAICANKDFVTYLSFFLLDLCANFLNSITFIHIIKIQKLAFEPVSISFIWIDPAHSWDSVIISTIIRPFQLAWGWGGISYLDFVEIHISRWIKWKNVLMILGIPLSK